MKKKYQSPVAELVALNLECFISTSPLSLPVDKDVTINEGEEDDILTQRMSEPSIWDND